MSRRPLAGVPYQLTTAGTGDGSRRDPKAHQRAPKLSTIAQATDVAPVSDFAKGSRNSSRIPRSGIPWVEVGTCLRVLSD